RPASRAGADMRRVSISRRRCIGPAKVRHPNCQGEGADRVGRLEMKVDPMPAQIACAWPQSLGRDHIVRGSIARLGTKACARAARAAAAAVIFVLAAASGAVAQTAIDVPAQSFDQGQAKSFKPVIKWRPDDSSWERERNGGPSFRVNVPLGAGDWAPITVRF